MRPQIYFEYHNVKYNTLTDLQRLILTYLVGCLTFEDSAIVAKDAGIVITQVDAYSVNFAFIGINPKLINDYYKKFPLLDMVRNHCNLQGNTMYVNDMVMSVRTKPTLMLEAPTR